MTSPQTVVEKRCESLDEFWTLLSPVGGQFDQDFRRFIFRGQRDSAWSLVPRVFRANELNKYKRGMLSLGNDHVGHWTFEYFLLSEFLFYCDRAGLVIPDDSLAFRRYFDANNLTNLHGLSSRDWPQEQVVPLMALAQHHGIPTRLLDWTDNSLVACYHAASSVVQNKIDGSGDLAVFALDVAPLQQTGGRLKHIRVPGSTSPNLSVQQGSFVLVANYGSRGEPFESDVSVESRLLPGSSILHKITLPQSRASELLFRCAKYGISAASIFPGYDGTARAAMESIIASGYVST
jgi:hypothetical protein